MSKHTQSKIVSTVVRDIPLDKLVPSKANVRRKHSAANIEARAASILAHGLLQNLVVRAERDGHGAETGKFEVTAGRGRLAALKLLAKRKKIAKDRPVLCNVREDGIAEELSLAENVERENLHPAEEFEAFHDLHVSRGLSAEEIAARFGVTERHMKERLKLGAVSAKLIALYRNENMTLEQLMAFTVSDDPARQEEVWNGLSWDKTPAYIRSVLLASHVPATDKRARFVGSAAYETAGGTILRDLFDEESGGYFADPALLDRIVMAKLEDAAEIVRAEGWNWVEVANDFPHGGGFGRFYEREVALSGKDAKKAAALETEIAECEQALEAEDADEGIEAKLDALQTKLAAYDSKRFVFDPEEVSNGGAFVVIGHDGEAEIVRGLIRLDDQRKARAEASQADSVDAEVAGVKEGCGLSDRLTADLTAHRTMALRDALAGNPDVALTALVHALVLQRFYFGTNHETCLDVAVRSVALSPLADNIEESVASRATTAREEGWGRKLPKAAAGAWAFVAGLVVEDRLALLAHCIAQSVDAVSRSGASPAVPSADRLAGALSLDMTGYWQVSVASYFSRVSKAKIAEALCEAGQPDAARRMAGSKKADMATAAETLLAGQNWLPEILRTPGSEASAQAYAEAPSQAAE